MTIMNEKKMGQFCVYTLLLTLTFYSGINTCIRRLCDLFGVTDIVPKGHSGDIYDQLKGQYRVCLTTLGDHGSI